MGGFPTWTLIGMGASAGFAIFFTALAYLAQSPNLLVRFRMAGSRISQSGRRLTGLGLAATLVGGGFFMAGVPLGPTELVAGETAAADGESIASLGEGGTDNGSDSSAAVAEIDGDMSEQPAADDTGAFDSPVPSDGDPSSDSSANDSGAFSQPAQATQPADGTTPAPETGAAASSSEVAATNTPSPSATPEPTQTATSTSTPRPTSTPTSTPTNTPTPTITPTAISSETINVSFNGDITWVYRVPGNQRLQLVDNGEQLLLGSGRAMVLGITWQEVRLLDGRPGWIQLSLLDLGEEEN